MQIFFVEIQERQSPSYFHKSQQSSRMTGKEVIPPHNTYEALRGDPRKIVAMPRLLKNIVGSFLMTFDSASCPQRRIKSNN